MSDIIPFPKLKEKLTRDIIEAIDGAHYELAYDAFNDYERHFELTSQLALLKCEVLWELNAFFELKEEANILMLQGFSPYDTLMIYYIKSLYALEQYRSTVEMVDQVIDEVNAHETRLALLPLKNQAQAKLDERQDYLLHRLQQMHILNHYEQTQMMLTLIDDKAYQFSETVAYILMNEEIVPSVQSLMLEYLRFARYNHDIPITKTFGHWVVNPTELKGIEHTDFKSQLMPNVIERLETDMPSLVQEAYLLLNTHNIALYPVDIFSYGSLDSWQNAYIAYFNQLMGFTKDLNESTAKILKLINSLNT